MFFPNKKFKANKFQLVRIPSPASYFAKVGYRVPGEASYTGDERIPVYSSKLDTCSMALNEARQHLDDFRKEHPPVESELPLENA